MFGTGLTALWRKLIKGFNGLNGIHSGKHSQDGKPVSADIIFIASLGFKMLSGSKEQEQASFKSRRRGENSGVTRPVAEPQAEEAHKPSWPRSRAFAFSKTFFITVTLQE